ncbi:MAG: hypothetical protein JHC95_05500 [Solirubrobacteraceae bacterium]|nr:hypothetical protein [Solirubrobacteraceae bacterium]
MHLVSGASLRLSLAFFAGTCLLLLGFSGSAHASTYTDLQGAEAGDQIVLTEGTTLAVGNASTDGATTTITDATLDFGGIVGTDVTASVTTEGLTLSGGSFAVPEALSTKVHTIDDEDPFRAAFTAEGALGDFSGELVSTDSASGAPAALRTLQAFADQPDEPTVRSIIPTAGPTESYRFTFSRNGTVNQSSQFYNSWTFQVFMQRGGGAETRIVNGITYGNTVGGASRWRYSINLDYPFVFKGKTVQIAGTLAGNDIFNVTGVTTLSGAINGDIELAHGVWFTGASVSWNKADGFKLGGSARIDCAQGGAVTGAFAGGFEDEQNWSVKLTGGTSNGCKVTKDLDLPAGSVIGEIGVADGQTTGLFELTGKVSTTLLPAGVDEWDAGFRFLYDGTTAGSYIGFVAEAGIGKAQGKIGFDGTFGLDAHFAVPFGGSNVAFDGTINRTSPTGDVTYDVGGSANIDFGAGKGSLGGSLRLTNSELSFSGDVTLACPISGSVKAGASTSVPLDGGDDWSIALSGGTANGCQVTDEFGLADGSGISGEVKSVGGVVSTKLDGNATIDTTIIPTKTTFSAGFKFAASQGDYSVGINASTDGAGFSADVASNGTFALAFNLDDLKLGGTSLGAKGSIEQSTPGGNLAYDISGGLGTPVKLYDKLWLQNGSVGISSTGGLTFSGAVRQYCATGSLDASASGSIANSRNWQFDLGGSTAAGCELSSQLSVPAGSLSGQLKSVSDTVSGTFAIGGPISTSILPASVSSWDAQFGFVYDGTPAGSNVSFSASSSIGTAKGQVNFDGTLALKADFTIPFGPADVAFKGDITRSTPGGAVAYDVGGSISNIAIGTKASLGGGLRLTNTSIGFDGSVTVACPISGSVTGGASGTVPIGSGRDWSLGVSGSATACGVTNELTIGSSITGTLPSSSTPTGITGVVSSTGGVVAVALDANATVSTTLIPTKTTFSAGFKFAASQGAYSIGVNASTTGASFDANVASNGTFGLNFKLDDLALGGTTLGARGTIARTTPGGSPTYTISGGLSSPVSLYDKLSLQSGSLSISSSGGLSFAGTVRQTCATGSVDATASGAITDSKNWSFGMSGGTTTACTITQGLTLPSGGLNGTVKATGGAVSASFSLSGGVSTSLLPAGPSSWNASFGFTYDGTSAGTGVSFSASSSLGSASGKVNFDGTFALTGSFTVPFGPSNVAFNGSIARTSPTGAVSYNVGGSATIAIGSKASLTGSLQLTQSSITLAGSVTLACPVSGSVTAGASGTVPIGSGKDWAFTIGGTTGAAGCAVTKEFAIGANSGASGTLKSVAGVVSLNLDANATIGTSVIPTKSSFTVGFKFAASQGAYNVALSGSTTGAGFSAAVNSDGTFNLSFNLGDLALGGVTLGAKGTIARTTAGGALTYSISGSLAGQAKLYDNLYLRSGSLSISNTGGLSFSGTVRQTCTTGYLDASASGTIVNSTNWSFDARGLASSCTLGRAGLFNGTTFSADIDSVNNKVTYSAGVAATQINLYSAGWALLGQTSTWLTNVSATISNTCDGCQAGGKNRITFRGTGNARFTLLFIPQSVSATVDGVFDFSGTTVRRVSINVTKINWNFFTLTTQAALINVLECDTEKGFTTA